MNASPLVLLALALYVGAEGFAIAHLRRNSPAYGRATTALLAAGMLLHFVALELRGRSLHSVPYRDLPDSMSLFAWMLAATYGLLLVRHRERSTAPFLLPLVIVFLAVSSLMPSRVRPANPKLAGSLFAFHVTLAILGYAALSLSFILALLYLVQTRQLRRRQTGLLFSRLPALDVLDGLQRTAIGVGVVSLSVASVLGGVWAQKAWGSVWDAKLVWTVLTIGVYISVLLAGPLGLRGKKTALLSITGFSLILFSYTIVNLVFSQEHVFR
jgi:ABC-type transport system involved in cytochrome c biogenesis permease subunit